MHEAGGITLAAVLEKHHHALSDELTALFASTVREAVDLERTRSSGEVEKSRETGRREAAESLNQALRRIRQAESQAAVLGVLRSAAGAYATRAVVVSVEQHQSASDAASDDEEGRTEARSIGNDPELRFDLANAPAVRSVVESKDPVVALPVAAELGVELAGAVGGESGKAYLFPVTVRQQVTAVLIVGGGVAPAPPELLCEAAGLRLEALTAPASRPAASLVQIAAPVVPASESGGARSWNDLSAEDQKLHLQAQRVARVKVAEIRLAHPDAIRKGTFEGNLYTALQPSIDAARAEFLQSFLAKSATMVDYLHLEILRSLAHDDDRLLGKDYPGPMV